MPAFEKTHWTCKQYIPQHCDNYHPRGEVKLRPQILWGFRLLTHHSLQAAYSTQEENNRVINDGKESGREQVDRGGDNYRANL